MMERVMDAGVGQPVGVSGLAGTLVIAPLAISSASSTGVSSVFSGVGPAPEMPGTTESIVFARMLQNRGFSAARPGSFERNAMDTLFFNNRGRMSINLAPRGEWQP